MIDMEKYNDLIMDINDRKEKIKKARFYYRGEQPVKKMYYKLSEVAGLIGELGYVIRFWASQFDMHLKRGKNGRLFGKNDIAKLMMIKYLLREEKYTIAGAKAKLKTINV